MATRKPLPKPKAAVRRPKSKPPVVQREVSCWLYTAIIGGCLLALAIIIIVAGYQSRPPRSAQTHTNHQTDNTSRQNHGLNQRNASNPLPQNRLPAKSLPPITTLKRLSRAAGCPGGTILNTVAHQDDDILFMNPDLQQYLKRGACVRTIYFTAGDDGRDAGYWRGREQGPDAAYSTMLGTADHWIENSVYVNGHQIIIHSLESDPGISLVFLRLPDGYLDGSGFASTGWQSLQGLRDGRIKTINSLDGVNAYSSDQLLKLVETFIQTDNPQLINTQAAAPNLTGGDHSDHQAVGYITRLAVQAISSQSTLHSYLGYQISGYPSNLTSDQITSKKTVFSAYTRHDPLICNHHSCFNSFVYAPYLTREYQQTN